MTSSACLTHAGRELYDSPVEAHRIRRARLKRESDHRIELVSHCKRCNGWFLTAAPTTFREIKRLAGVTA